MCDGVKSPVPKGYMGMKLFPSGSGTIGESGQAWERGYATGTPLVVGEKASSETKAFKDRACPALNAVLHPWGTGEVELEMHPIGVSGSWRRDLFLTAPEIGQKVR